jgi:hypothetical protein
MSPVSVCENAVVLEIGGSTVLVAALKGIVRSKELANHEPDHEAVPELGLAGGLVEPVAR